MPGMISIAAGAEETPLASMLAEIIESNLENGGARVKAFRKLGSAVHINAADAGVEITLLFEKGRLTVHAGKPVKPAISIEADSATLLDLTNLEIKGGLPYFFDETGRGVVRKLFRGELKMKGLLLHPLELIRLTKVLSVA